MANRLANRRRARRLHWSLLLLAAYVEGCGGQNDAPRIPVAVVLGGSPELRPQVEAALKSHPIENATVRVVAPARIGALATAAVESPPLGAVRKKYLAADIDGCLDLLGDDARLDALLAAHDRATAARVLFWRIACHVAGDHRAAAERDAASFAALGLRMPLDARDASPDVENLIDRATQRATNVPAVDVEVTANTPRTVVRVDGREESCIAPCAVKVSPGAHVVTASADGAIPATVRVLVESSKKDVSMTLASAPPDVAATQWRARYESTTEEQSADSARLLSAAVPSRYLVVLSSERSRLRGLVYFDREVQARAESVGASTSADAPSKVIDELLHRSKLIESKSLFSSPLFWGVAAGVAVAASVVTYFVLRDPPERTEVFVR